MSETLRSHGLWHIRLLCPWNSPGRDTGVGTIPSPRGLPYPGIEPGSPVLRADSLPSGTPDEAEVII